MLIRDAIYDIAFFVIELLKPLEIDGLAHLLWREKSALPSVVVLVSVNSAELKFYCRVTADHSPVKLAIHAISKTYGVYV